MKFLNIKPKDLQTILVILKQYLPEYEVRAFGSRVQGTAGAASDLDLAIMTSQPLDTARMADLREALAQSDLPFKVDLMDWASISEQFRKIIEAGFEVLQPQR